MKPRKKNPQPRLADIPERGRLRLFFAGIVQGVGFRPFLYRAAKKFKLTGFVKNTSAGVTLEVEGGRLPEFITHVTHNAPPLSHIETLSLEKIPIKKSNKFLILESEANGRNQVMVSPDIALCANCRKEMADPGDRRHGYPFTNCTDCGPRFTIIEGLPYDRPRTTMKGFAMCPDCAKEYRSPLDRRYHAQPVSCPQCGPKLALHVKGKAEKTDPLAGAVRMLQAGKVLAVKGIGGYHLACRADRLKALERLRAFKKRESKPFALMATLAMIRSYCRVSALEKKLLESPAAPIVLLAALPAGKKLLARIAPGQNRIGFMMPYSPLHRLLLQRMSGPLVMTSANLADEPLVFNDSSRTLPRLADAVLSHDRPIRIFCDDSVLQAHDQGAYFVRRSRGFVPLPIQLPFSSHKTVLALGGMLKTTFTLLQGDRALVSQHIGDTGTASALAAEKEAVAHFLDLFGLRPEIIAIDSHPAYPNRMLAADFPSAEIVEIQHHRAHIASLLAERGETGKVLGIALDGTGYGDDRTVWGGEFFTGDLNSLERAGHLLPIFLPGGDAAAREPWRIALSLLMAIPGAGARAERFARRFGRKGEQVLECIAAHRGGVMTSSCGRLFDGAAALLGLGDVNQFEGQLPMRLQAEAEKGQPGKRSYPFAIEINDGMAVLNMLPAVEAMLTDKAGRAEKAYAFHASLAQALLAMTSHCLVAFPATKKVAFSGGVMQNLLLLRLCSDRLSKNGFQALHHAQVPANDGGLSLGQAALAAAKNRKE